MVGGADISNWSWFNPDDLLAYETPKVVVIRDRRLGCLYYFICFLIGAYVFGFQILYANEHFPKTAVTGTTRLEITQPTKENCDADDDPGCKSGYISLEQLEYCKEFSGQTDLLSVYQKPCIYADKHSILPGGHVEEHILIPTTVESEVQDKDCQPGPDNQFTCENEYKGTGNKDMVYVADVEDYMLSVHHTFNHLLSGGGGAATQGYYLVCDKSEKEGFNMERTVYERLNLDCPDGTVRRKPIQCLYKDCAFLDKEEDKAPDVSGTLGFTDFLQKTARSIKHYGGSLLMGAAKKLDDEMVVASNASSASAANATHSLHRLPIERHAKVNLMQKKIRHLKRKKLVRRNLDPDETEPDEEDESKPDEEGFGNHRDETEPDEEELNNKRDETEPDEEEFGNHRDETEPEEEGFRKKHHREKRGHKRIGKKHDETEPEEEGFRRNVAVGAEGHLKKNKHMKLTKGALNLDSIRGNGHHRVKDVEVDEPEAREDSLAKSAVSAKTYASAGGNSDNNSLPGISVTREPDDIPGITPGTPLHDKMKEGVWARPDADVFTVKKVLELAGLNLDTMKNGDGKTVRQAGTVVTIEAVYWNLHPWTSCFGSTEVEYEYRISKRPVEHFSTFAYSEYQPNYPSQRILEQRHGIFVIVKLGGMFGTFSFSYLCVLVATTVGLMKVSIVVTDKVSMYLMQMAETYHLAKYQYTDRVWELQKQLDSLLNFGDALDDLDAASAAGSEADGAAGVLPRAKPKAKAGGDAAAGAKAKAKAQAPDPEGSVFVGTTRTFQSGDPEPYF